MKTWALSIGAVLLLISTINLILPKGKTSKIIKPIFSFLLIFVIIKPLVGLTDFDFSDVINNQNDFTIQTGFIDYVSTEKIKSYKEKVNKILEDFGVYSAKIDINYSISENEIDILSVIINLENSVINNEISHIDISKKIKKKVAEFLYVSEGLIKVVYE